MVNFKSAPQVLHDEILSNYLKLSNFQLNLLFRPETVKELRNRNVNIFSTDIIYKYKIKTFDYFTHAFLNCFELNIFNLPFKNFLIFYNHYSNVIYTSLTNTFTYFNLNQQNFNWIKSLD